MTDNEIIKELQAASEWFSEHGRNTNTAIVGICDRAIELINRQKAEIEELEAEIDKQYEQARADILGNMADGGTSCHWCIDQHKAEAVKEFAETLKSKHRRILDYDEAGFSAPTNIVYVETIDNLVKEFTEGSKR